MRLSRILTELKRGISAIWPERKSYTASPWQDQYHNHRQNLLDPQKLCFCALGNGNTRVTSSYLYFTTVWCNICIQYNTCSHHATTHPRERSKHPFFVFLDRIWVIFSFAIWRFKICFTSFLLWLGLSSILFYLTFRFPLKVIISLSLKDSL